MGDDLRKRAGREHDRRDAGLLGFDVDHAEALALGGQRRATVDGGSGKEIGNVLAVAEERHASGQVGGGGAGPELLTVAGVGIRYPALHVAHHVEPHVVPAVDEDADRVQQDVDPLLGDDLPHVDELVRVARGASLDEALARGDGVVDLQGFPRRDAVSQELAQREA